jgi:cytoskeletal protein CcmA (bactofilin family)
MRHISKNLKKWKMRFGWFGVAVVVLGLLIVLATPVARAADFRSGENVVIDASTVINDDLYVAANQVVIDGTVKGDVYVFGNIVTINGTVEHDVIGGAQVMNINGTVGDTLRVGAQSIVLGDKAKVARSALIGGMALETRPGSVVGHDLMFGAYQAALGGTVQHDIVAGAYGIQVSGTVGRNVRVSVGDATDEGPSPMLFMPNLTVAMPSVPPGLTLAPTAKIGGDVVYESNTPLMMPSGAQVTGPIVQQTPVPQADVRRRPPTPEEIQAQQTQQTVNYFLDAGRRLIIWLLIGLVVMWLLPKWIQVLAEFIRTKPLGSFGRGILVVLGYGVALIALVMVVLALAILFGVLTLGGLAGAIVLIGTVLFGALMVGYYVFVSYIAPIVVSYFGGRWILERVQPQWAQNRFVVFVVGLILLWLVSLIPILNVLVGWVVAVFALGALVLWAAPWFERRGATVMQTA